ncbi:MAG: hypothetical protein WD544_00830, partial [Patescibacteria group bacterium]
MKNFKILVILLGLMFASATPAQLLELGALLFGGIANSALANSQRDEIGTLAIECDVYREDSEGNLHYLGVWPASRVPTLTYWPDDIVFQVKAFTSGPPPRDLKYYLDDQMIAFRDVDSGDWSFSKKKIIGAKGVIDGYPFIRARDIPIGVHQFKVLGGRGEWGTAIFSRQNEADFIRAFQSELNRLAATGGGASMTPAWQSLTALLPDGTVRNFASLEQMQLELAAMQQQGFQRQEPPVQGSQGQANTSWGGQGYQIKQSPPDLSTERNSLFEIHVYRYDDVDRKVGDKDAIMRHLALRASEQQPHQGDTIGVPNNGDGVAILIFSREEMKIEYVSSDGQRHVYKNGRADTPDGPIYSALVNLTLGRGQKPTGKLLITVGGTTKEIKFKEA